MPQNFYSTKIILNFWRNKFMAYGNVKSLVPRLHVRFRNKLIFYSEELLDAHPTSKLEDNPLSAVRNCLFNTFAATLHTCRVSPPSAKYMLLSRHQNSGQNHDIKINNRCFENVEQFRYLDTTITNWNLIQEEIKRRLISGNACCHSVHNLLSSRLLSRNIKTSNSHLIH
jgi:hypothetical protein